MTIPLKTEIERLLSEALDGLAGNGLPEEVRGIVPNVERARDPRHGDFATNLAMGLAKPARQAPRQIAEAIISALPESPLVAATEIAGPGFINFRLTAEAHQRELTAVLDAGPAYGRAARTGGEPLIVEFVSANPTGPLHVGHGRHAAYGDSVANLLDAAGHTVVLFTDNQRVKYPRG
mgnify:FL=1